VRLLVDAGAVKARARAGWPKSVAFAEAQRQVASSTPAGADAAAHAQAIASVLAELGEHADMQGSRLDVEIGSALLHLDVVEGDFGAQTDRHLQGVAAACVAEMLGDEADRRAARWHLQRDDRHLLIVALAQDWIDLLQAAAASAGLRLASVEPSFIARWNERGRAMKPGHGIFAVCGGGDLAIAAVADGAIAAISVGTGVDLRVDSSGPAPRQAQAFPRPDPAVSSGFSPDRQGMATVDERVDRLLSGRGQDPQAQSAFVLVAPDVPSVAASTRWSVFASPETST
jgi:hypothetical protein